MTRICGFWPFYYNQITRTYQIRRYILLHAAIACVVLSLAFIVGSKIVQQAIRKKFKTDTAKYVTDAYFTLILILLITNYAAQFWNLQKQKTFIGRARALVKQFESKLTHKYCFYDLTRFLLKTITISIISVTVVVSKIYLATKSMKFITIVFIYLIYLATSCIANVYYAGMATVKYGFQQININITKHTNAAVQMLQSPDAKLSKFRRMKQYCELSDAIDELAILHSDLCRITNYTSYNASDFIIKFFLTHFDTWQSKYRTNNKINFKKFCSRVVQKVGKYLLLLTYRQIIAEEALKYMVSNA